ncbi:MAG: TetR/AcrR family transcriptional regulator [Desulfocucumaceae bacterium]
MKSENHRLIKAKMTKKKIYETALKLFEQEGYDKTTVAEIVERAGVSKGSFFVYFPKKDHVVLQYFKDLDQYLEEIGVELDGSGSPVEKIVLFFCKSNDYILKIANINLIKTFYQSQISLDSDDSYLTGGERPTYRWIEKWVTEAREQNLISPEYSPDDLTDMILTVCRGILFDWCLNNGKFDLNDRSRKLLKIFFSGLSNHIEAD